MIRFLALVLGIVGLLGLTAEAGQRVWSAATGPAPAPAAVAAGMAGLRTAEGAATLEFKGRALQAFSETAARPVFFEGRRYPAVAKPVEPAPVAARPAPATTVSAEGIKLLGVMLAGGTARALISVQAAPASWVAEGEKVQMWTVQAIRRNSVRLAANANSQFATVSIYPGAGDN